MSHVCIYSESSVFVYVTPVGFFWGGVVCVLAAAVIAFVDLGRQDLWMLVLGHLVETQRCSLLSRFLSRPSAVPHSLGEVIGLGTRT